MHPPGWGALFGGQGKTSHTLTNHTQICTGQTQRQSTSDKSHPILLRQTHSVNQTNHNLLSTGQTQRQSANDKSHLILHRQTQCQSIRQITTYSAQGKTASVSQWQITPNFAQANTQCQSDKSQLTLHKANTASVSQWQITQWSDFLFNLF